jgi:hypothetical protein
MRSFRIAVFVLVLTLAAIADEEPKTTITVTELPPEAFPAGTCTETSSGYLVIKKGGKESSTLTPEQIGTFVAKRLSEGYSVFLYPQISGRIFSITKCESPKG